MGGASGVAAGGAAGAAAPPPAAPADASPAPAARADAGTASAPGETDNGDCKDIDKKLLLVEKGPTCSSPSPRPAFRRSGMSAGCGKAAPAAGKRSLEVCAGKPRDFILQLPQNYDPQKAYPLVFTFHHAYGYAESPLGYGGLAKSLADKAIIISPQALSPKVKPCFTTWSRNFKDDLALFDALVDFATNNLCVDQGKLFATGLSSGGFFSTSLGCQRGDVLRGIMPVAGGLRDFYSCKGGVGALLVLQPNDTNVRDSFLKLNGCTPSATPPASQPDPKICASYTCKPETPVTHCTYGHAWPSWAAKAMWDFWTVLPPVP
jgi:poly(3-hydroxybutyrate) depolymerase